MASDATPGVFHLDGKQELAYQAGEQKEYAVAKPQLSVRSAKAGELAHRLARCENRSIAEIVEQALEAYEAREIGRGPASAFYCRLSNDYGSDICLDTIIEAEHRAHQGPKL